MLTVQVGGLNFAPLGRVAVCDEGFLYAGLVALIDLILLRLVSTTEESVGDNIPAINPVALLWWFEGKKQGYEQTCEQLGLAGFKRVSKEIYSEERLSTIFCDIRKRLNLAPEIDTEHVITGKDQVIEKDSDGCSSKSSEAFILKKAKRLAEFIPHKHIDIFAAAFDGGDEDEENMRFAVEIINGKASQDVISAASIDVVNMIVDILLYSPTKGVKTQEKPSGDGSNRAHRL
ncbi:hypothetical protein J3458_001198 [Metarhizium acridum]|uniref:uncharacterized protein n=1 Tax=Metarhizium acridum TaxID=92637 RepID=UPI001C6B6737|nr:hypothetical protein J3458_001198 [Metarhizium acridum]